MRWDMEVEEIEAVLEKIWDLHDKLSDAIHTISRAHFLNSIRNLRRPDAKKNLFGDAVEDNSGGGGGGVAAAGVGGGAGYVYVKEIRVDENESSIQEAKSLSAIRTALENLGEQLEFFHTVQMQQRAERDAAIARLEQSRIVLSLRLAEHHGKKNNVIEEALAFIGDVHNATRFVTADNLYAAPTSLQGRASNAVVNVLVSSFDFAKRLLRLDNAGGVLGNAALFAISMLALLHIQHQQQQADSRVVVGAAAYNQQAHRKRASEEEGSSSSEAGFDRLNVMLARG